MTCPPEQPSTCRLVAREEAASRELREETGFTRVKVEPVGYSYTFPIRDKHLYESGATEITEHVFIAFIEDDGDPQISPREHTEWLWCTFNEAVQLLYWPSNIEALRRTDEVVRRW